MRHPDENDPRLRARVIVQRHLDEGGFEVAELACGHRVTFIIPFANRDNDGAPCAECVCALIEELRRGSGDV